MSLPPLFLSALLEKYKTPRSSPQPASRPHVTLTFAQSLDAKIAGKGGKQLILSGKESMVMTHWMRTMHDAILVGIQTALNDDPQLNTRHLPPRAPNPSQNGHNDSYHLPRPIILDTNLRLSPDCKLLKNFQNGTGRRPWVLCAAPKPSGDSSEIEAGRIDRRRVLESAGARIVEIGAVNEDGHLQLSLVLETLHSLGIQSLMVEGGARIIRSFFSQAIQSGGNTKNEAMVDTIIVTVAPTFVGDQGVSYGAAVDEVSRFKHVETEIFGQDSVIALTPA